MIKSTPVLLVFLLATAPFLQSCQQNAKREEAVYIPPPNSHVQKAEVSGIKNFSRVGVEAGFGGATQSTAMTWLKDDGFVTVINLRGADEEGVEVGLSHFAAQKAGLKYVHMPFDPSNFDQEFIDQFLAVIDDEQNQPVYMHCGSATRASALWMIKRVSQDGWSIEEASEEARGIAKNPDKAIGLATGYLEPEES